MRYIYLLIILCCLGCNNERVLQLPEIKNAEVTEVLDVSPAYIFYDETQPDSTFLNRKNLISTTNWLVNVDKRLTLKQAIPHIKFLQDKKRKAKMHKNENAKNYFTCNDTSIGNLGFIEFTYSIYHNQKPRFFVSDISDSQYANNMHLVSFGTNEHAKISPGYSIDIITVNNKLDLEKEIKSLDTVRGRLILKFDKNLNFQDYIYYKAILKKIDLNNLSFSPDEFIY